MKGDMPISKIKYKMEFSKKIFIGVSTATTLITVFSMYMIWKTSDTSMLAYLIPAMFTELATATGFYYNKAREENIRKIENNNNLKEEVEKI